MGGRQFLTEFELMILLAILRVGEEAYGVPIAREIEATAKRPVMLGAIYTGLDRLERKGFVTSTLGDPSPERGGKAKRFFVVTRLGLRSIKEARRAFTALWSDVRQLRGKVAET
jgi:PadR family transcriptional regulator, regulatory protein PadR